MTVPALQPGDLEVGMWFDKPGSASWLDADVRDRLIANGYMRMWRREDFLASEAGGPEDDDMIEFVGQESPTPGRTQTLIHPLSPS